MAYYETLSRQQLLTLVASYRKIIDKQKKQLKDFKCIEQSNKDITKLNKKLTDLTSSLKIKENKVLNNQKIIDKLTIENNTYRQAMSALVHKNKDIFKKYFNKLSEEDDLNVSGATVLLDFEYMIVFKKLFEMHIFDYIVDRQLLRRATSKEIEEENIKLISECKKFADTVIQNELLKTKIGVNEFWKDFKQFASQYIEENKIE